VAEIKLVDNFIIQPDYCTTQGLPTKNAVEPQNELGYLSIPIMAKNLFE
jgi:hypothetical protein